MLGRTILHRLTRGNYMDLLKNKKSNDTNKTDLQEMNKDNDMTNYKKPTSDNDDDSTIPSDSDSRSADASVSDADSKKHKAVSTQVWRGKNTSPSAIKQKQVRAAKHKLAAVLAKPDSSWDQKDRDTIRWAGEVLKGDTSQPVAGRQQPSTSSATQPSLPPSGPSKSNLNKRPPLRKEGLTKTFAPVSGASNTIGGNPKSLPASGRPSAVPANKVSTTKRPRSFEETSTTSKKAKNADTAHRPFNEVVKDNMLYGIYDHGNDEGKMSGENWLKLKAILAGEVLKFLDGNPSAEPPSFADGGWFSNGVKLVKCRNNSAVEFLKSTIPKTNPLWNNAGLQVMHWSDIPIRPKGRVWLPPGPSTEADILRLIRLQNPDLPTSNWKIIKAGEPEERGRLVSFLMNKESLDLLSSRGYTFCYGMDELVMRVQEKEERLLSGVVSTLNNLGLDAELDGPSPVSAVEANQVDTSQPAATDGSKYIDDTSTINLSDELSSDSEESNRTVIEASVSVSKNAKTATD